MNGLGRSECPDTLAVVFDMDGVLVDSHPAHLAAWREFLDSLSLEVSNAELAFILEGRTRSEILRHFLGELSEGELVEYGRRKDEIFRQLEGNIQPFPGVLAFLDQLEHLPICRAVATSASEIRTASTIERMGLGGYFDAVVTSADVVAGKPHPQVYQLACARMNVLPQHALAFDDAPSGVRSACSAGLQCIGVSQNGLTQALLDAGADKVIPNFLDLNPALVLSPPRPLGCDEAGHAGSRITNRAAATSKKVSRGCTDLRLGTS